MIVGTAGHIDHGKTALIRALTGVDTDRLKEEKVRGITIDLGFAYLPTPGGRAIGFVDVPGHERFVRTMVAGASGIDFALLAVAADDGCKPQTLEHLAILDLLGVNHGLVALTKVDLVLPDRLHAATQEIRTALAGSALADAQILPVSAITGAGIETLREQLFAAADGSVARPSENRFRLAIDRCFVLAGVGVVVTGTVLSGVVRVGDRVTISPSGLPARVRSLHAQNQAADEGRAGDRCALNLTGEGVERDAIRRGDVALDPELHAPAERIDASLRLLGAEAAALRQGITVRVHSGATEVGARLVRLDDKPIAPGSVALAQLALDRPIAAAIGDSYVLRDASGQHTLGGGRFLDLRAPARRRRAPERQALLGALVGTGAAEALRILLTGPACACAWRAFARDHALSEAQAAALAQAQDLTILGSGDDAVALAPDAWARWRRELAETLSGFHSDNPDVQGQGREALRLSLQPRLSEPAFRAALQRLVPGGAIVLDGAFVRLASHTVRLTAADEALWEEIAPLLADAARFRPPRARDIADLLDEPEDGVRRLLKLAARLGRVDEVAHDHFFLRATVQEMARIAAEVAIAAPEGSFTAAQFRDQLDNGRKVAIQILEFFDRHGVTQRTGDLRRIGGHADVFGPPAST
ncbi:MAG TPA: selenocysteine-specific translation elongation factor [Caulobacteraceae bacterium]|nr:selenocysteine-specific translation elongation factor [Caulobacteraceae bacterium]